MVLSKWKQIKVLFKVLTKILRGQSGYAVIYHRRNIDTVSDVHIIDSFDKKGVVSDMLRMKFLLLREELRLMDMFGEKQLDSLLTLMSNMPNNFLNLDEQTEEV